MIPEEQRRQEEEQIKNNFSELQKKLENLKNEVKTESDDSKKQEKNEEIQKLEKELSEIKTLIDTLSKLEEQDLESLKTKLESIKKTYQEYWREAVELKNEKSPTSTTYEILKWSETSNRLLNIIESNPDKFKDLPWDTAEKKLEYIFEKIRWGIVQFLKNKLWKSENVEKIIDNTIAPAFERNLMGLLRDQWNETNVGMLQWMDSISWNSLWNLFDWVKWFADKFSSSYSKFNQWMNAIDYLSVHNGVLREPSKSGVLTDPLKFQKYMNNKIFDPTDENGDSISFSPYSKIDENIFEVDETKNFEFGIALQEKQDVLEQIWHIQVVNNPRTTALIVKMLDKPEQFLKQTEWLQQTANGLLDWIESLNSVTNIFWIDLLWEITKDPEERGFLYKILDFVCKLIWITWWLEWIVKKWRLDKMNLTDEKNENISQIFKKYKELAWENTSLSITNKTSCEAALKEFEIKDSNTSTTKWDFLRDSIVENMDVSLISPVVVKQLLWNSYLKKERNGENKEQIIVDESKITEDDKLQLANKHLKNMKKHLEKYKDLSDFYKNINSTEDIALCITASLYADKNDVIEWVKAKVFLPENYWAVRLDWTVADNQDSWRENLDSSESADKQKVSEQWMYDKAIEYWITDKRQIAYVLATVKWECEFKNQKEIWWENKNYWKVDSSTWKAYYGRWFIQLTHKYNYQKYTQIIQSLWRDFKDNSWNTLKWSEIDLVNNPDIILQSNDLAAFIIVDWMKNWWPDRVQSKRLDNYINDSKTDYYNARSIVNWMSSKPQTYADMANNYLDKIWSWSVDSPTESKELLIWPKLLAHNKDEIWWLWNSIMNWFQWLDAKTHFPQMDGSVWKSTLTHPNKFSSQNDVLAYKNTHPNIKSFMFYFGANTRDNNQTYSDIKQRSEWLQEEWIQPVLCTCIWEDKQTWLGELNQKIVSLWKEKSWPVLDFAKSYNKWDIKLSSDWVHPSSYIKMTEIINEQLNQA